LIPRRPGVRIKTDRLDARNLALALRAGTLTSVHIPTPEEEAFHDVVRAWQQSKRDVTAAKQRLKAFCCATISLRRTRQLVTRS
jgi:transposase